MTDQCQQLYNLSFNYNNVFFSIFLDNERMCHSRSADFGLSYILSGEMVLDDGERSVSVRRGECVFVPRDLSITMYKQPADGYRYEGIFLKFTRPFLRQMYESLGIARMRENIPRLEGGALKLQLTPELDSLFKSMTPYLDPAVIPSDDIMNLKLQEALLALLHIDRRFYPTLFDFSAPWKIDIIDFLNNNYMHDMSIAEMAHYTGRSLSAFKRDFKTVSSLTPERWIVNKRLEEARGLLAERQMSVVEVCRTVGFRNNSHFSTAFKRRYGITPTDFVKSGSHRREGE